MVEMLPSTGLSGYRPGTEHRKPKLYSISSLLSKPNEAQALRQLYEASWDRGANCQEDPGKWTGDRLPTDREAQAMCAGCPVRLECEAYVETAEDGPAHGVWAGKVFGRESEDG